ncbi:MAG: hypothetical protein P8H03_07385 [Emcibacteraceae bacterium]|nr:hypothetical protein [Emcibacteraceae bacterium]MDG1859654.1 hypothetical protein [Emcibacteraceae bacterium]
MRIRFYLKLLFIGVCSLISSISIAAEEMTKTGILLDESWKATVYEFAQENLQHSAWGVEHYERNFHMSKKIAAAESTKVDEDVLFAASFLHDMGVFEPYAIAGAEHSKTAADNIEAILNPTNFPNEKIEDVKATILAHMFYADAGDNKMAAIFHDADTLDFLGSIGVARIISITTRDDWATDLATAIKTIEGFNVDLPSKLIFEGSKEIAKKRVNESNMFIESLKSESNDGNAL